MSKYILKNKPTFADKNILELGCGLGLASIMCGKLSPETKVVATDGDEISISLTQQNIDLNNVQSNVKASRLLWNKDMLTAESFRKSDILIAADVVACVYAEAFKALVKAFQIFLAQKSDRLIFLAYEARNVSEQSFFETLQQDKSISIEEEETGYKDSQVKLYRISNNTVNIETT